MIQLCIVWQVGRFSRCLWLLLADVGSLNLKNSEFNFYSIGMWGEYL